MSAAQVVATSFVFVICVGGAVILPRVWRGWYGEGNFPYRGSRRTRGQIAFFWWPYGDASRRGVIRGLPVTICAGWALLISGLSAELTAEVSGEAALALHVVAIVFLILFGIALILNFTVIILNWPKFIVPPSQRREIGIFAERVAGRRAEK
jgi:hypothetical protein